jgi:hypothetical protein
MWNIVFEIEHEKKACCSQEELDIFLSNWNKQLSRQEINEIVAKQMNPFPESSPYYNTYKLFDPALWLLPQKNLPSSYLDFLRYSNGGEFQNGERYFQPMN